MFMTPFLYLELWTYGLQSLSPLLQAILRDVYRLNQELQTCGFQMYSSHEGGQEFGFVPDGMVVYQGIHPITGKAGSKWLSPLKDF